MLYRNKSRFSHHQLIFLAPGNYFHQEHSGVNYPALPPLLQQAHNKHLLQQYRLPLPNSQTPALPDLIAEKWLVLPKIAWGLGILLHPTPLPWWAQTSAYSYLHQRVSNNAWQYKEKCPTSPHELLAAGAEQLLACLAPYGPVYTTRVSHMFGSATQKLLQTQVKTLLPWNIIEETCHYASKI